jgi:hypothetical protein
MQREVENFLKIDYIWPEKIKNIQPFKKAGEM